MIFGQSGLKSVEQIKIMGSEIGLFYELLQVAIGSRNCLSSIPSSTTWEALYRLAVKQTVLGVCFYGVQKLPARQTTNISRSLKIKWLGCAARIQTQNELMNKRCVELQRSLCKDGLSSCILKGQANAATYPSFLSNLRQPGDIDVWVDGEFKELEKYVNNSAPTKEITRHHAHFNLFGDAEVELHFLPLVLNNPFKQKIFNRYCKEKIEVSCKNNVVLSDGKSMISTPNKEFNLVFQLLHIFHHLFTEGVGLRQLLDYYFLICATNTCQHSGTVNEDDDSVSNAIVLIHELNLDRFASSLMFVLHKVFGLKEHRMLWRLDTEYGQILLDEIMKTGNFGYLDERTPKGMNKWKSYLYGNGKALRLGCFDHWAWFWTPLTRFFWYVWRKRRGYN